MKNIKFVAVSFDRRRRNKSLLFTVVLILSSLKLSATHIVGGEITYACLGNNKYEVNLHVYRDCYNGVPPFDNPASLGIFDVNDQFLQSVNLIWNQLDDTLLIYLNNPCLTRPPNVCVHRTTYRTIITLLPRPGGYKLVYQRCCRNELIRNIPFPEDVGITIISEIKDEAIAGCNNSAVYTNWPPLAICAHEPIDFDHSASDSDGDSLAYRLCTPLSGADPLNPMPQPPNEGPYMEVSWKPPYSISNLLGGQPLQIDPNTGFMTGIPNMVGNFVVGVCVDEFREGINISTTRRDFQYNVADCGVPIAAFAAPAQVCDDLEVAFHNQTDLNELGISNWYFDWGGDQTLFSTEKNPTFIYPDTGHYQVTLITNPGYTCSDTTEQTIWLTETTANASMALTYPDCDETGLTINAVSNSTDALSGLSYIQWQGTGPGNWDWTSNDPNATFKISQPGTYQLLLKAMGGNGCPNDTLYTFVLPMLAGDTSDLYYICVGDETGLFPQAPPLCSYQWMPSPDISDLTMPNPMVKPTASTDYQVTITHPEFSCTWGKKVRVEVLPEGIPLASATPPSINAGESSQLTGLLSGSVSYTWSPSSTLSNANIQSPIATPTETTDYTVSVELPSGCVREATVRVLVLNPVCEAPYVFFPTGFSPNNDGENEVLKLETNYAIEVYWMIYNRFGEKVFEANSVDGFWDGTYKGKPQPAETYGYYYRVLCVNGEVTEKKGNVTLLR